MSNFQTKKGFTLLELLVVMSIIGLLASIIITSVNSARDKAKMAKAFATITSISKLAYVCIDTGGSLTIPASGGTGGTAICTGQTETLPNISDTNFTYCGTSCGGWISNAGGIPSYAISAYTDSFPGGRRIIACGYNYDASGWYSGVAGQSFNFLNEISCAKYGF